MKFVVCVVGVLLLAGCNKRVSVPCPEPIFIEVPVPVEESPAEELLRQLNTPPPPKSVFV
jgi:hypothetical protein